MANQENIRKWVEALRSGEYRQGKGYLQTGDGRFCCLGVACEISGLVEVAPPPERVTAKTGEFYTGGGERLAYINPTDESDWSRVVLPVAVQDWLGLDRDNPYLTWGDDRREAANLNDEFDLSFSEIADLIEEEYLTPAA